MSKLTYAVLIVANLLSIPLYAFGIYAWSNPTLNRPLFDWSMGTVVAMVAMAAWYRSRIGGALVQVILLLWLFVAIAYSSDAHLAVMIGTSLRDLWPLVRPLLVVGSVGVGGGIGVIMLTRMLRTARHRK